ncbi:unnamed protein product, partial [marine sediment metagenome]
MSNKKYLNIGYLNNLDKTTLCNSCGKPNLSILYSKILIACYHCIVKKFDLMKKKSPSVVGIEISHKGF